MDEVKKNRSFHDAWAFILYLLLTAATTAWMAVEMKEPPQYDKDALLPLLTLNVGLMLAFLLLAYLGLRYAAEEFIFTANVVAPATAFVLSMLTLDPIVILLAGIGFAVCLLFYFWAIKPVLPLMAACIQTTAKILASNLVGCILLLLVSVSLQVVQGFVFMRTLGNADANKSAVIVLFVLNSYWTLFNIVYFTQVVVSGIVIGHVASGRASFGQAFYNALMALGSVSFAGLIMAAISTARLLVQRDRDRNNERGSSNFLNILLLCILGVLGDLVDTMNELVFPYLALHGTRYTESMSKSYNMIGEKRGITLVSNVAIGKVISFCLLFFIELVVLGDALLLLSQGQPSPVAIATAGVVAVPLVVFVYSFLSMFSSGTLALIYSYVESPEMVKRVEPELAERMGAFN